MSESPKKKSGCHLMQDKALDLDQFGRRFQFNFPGEKDTLNTVFGLITTIAAVIVVIIYASMQVHRLNTFGENLITTSSKDSHFDDSYVITTESTGLKFAFALTAYDTNYDYVDESEYGHVSAMYSRWGIENDNSYSETKIPVRHCTPEELGITEGSESVFYPAHKTS